MGYTHYFSYEPRADSFIAAWPQIVDDARLIAEHVQSELGVRLAGGLGTGEPELDRRHIWLNGPDRGDLGHETLLIDPEPWVSWDEQAAHGHADWAAREREQFETRGFYVSFCKTARKPYDIAVTSILLRARHLASGSFVIGSDGDWDLEWQHGADHWSPGCARSVSPVAVVKTLFEQDESPERSRLVANVWEGPRVALGGPDA